MAKNLAKKFQNTSHQYDLWKRGDKIVVACSGGSDSACLLDIFAKLRQKYDLEFLVAHVNYGLRGKDSEKDEKFVRKLAEKFQVKLEIFHPHLALRATFSQKREKGKSWPSENELREIRYNFFEKIRVKNNFDYIAVGHTLDDQAETFLMRIIRGSGLAGMSAMRHKTNLIIRPMLGITKKEILEYLKKNKLKYRTDKTNKEIPYFRNKIRNELVPLLEKKYNSNIKETLYNSSLNIAEDYDLVSVITEESYRKNNNLKISLIKKLHPALQKRIILKAIENVRPNLKDIESAHIGEILKIIKSVKSKRQAVKLQGLKFTRIGDRLFISKSLK